MPKPDDPFTITFEDVEETAREFGRIAIHLPDHQMLIVMDDTIWGDGFIKQFDNNPDGLIRARRWAVRLDDVDENSSEPFETLRAGYLKDIGASQEKDWIGPLTNKDQAKALYKDGHK